MLGPSVVSLRSISNARRLYQQSDTSDRCLARPYTSLHRPTRPAAVSGLCCGAVTSIDQARIESTRNRDATGAQVARESIEISGRFLDLSAPDRMALAG